MVDTNEKLQFDFVVADVRRILGQQDIKIIHESSNNASATIRVAGGPGSSDRWYEPDGVLIVIELPSRRYSGSVALSVKLDAGYRNRRTIRLGIATSRVDYVITAATVKNPVLFAERVKEFIEEFNNTKLRDAERAVWREKLDKALREGHAELTGAEVELPHWFSAVKQPDGNWTVKVDARFMVKGVDGVREALALAEKMIDIK